MTKYKSLYLALFLLFLSLLQGCGSVPHQPAPGPVAVSGQPAPAGSHQHAEAQGAHAPPAVRSARLDKGEGVLLALLALGVDYRSGGHSRETGFDCSGLVAHVYESAFNVRLPRVAHAQAQYGSAIEVSQLEAGDLLFYDTLGQPNSHVGIYIGDGRFVHAPKAGAKVRVEHLRTSYWVKRFNGARRVPLI